MQVEMIARGQLLEIMLAAAWPQAVQDILVPHSQGSGPNAELNVNSTQGLGLQ